MKSHLFTCVGISHLTSPVEERETLAFAPDELLPTLTRFNVDNRGVEDARQDPVESAGLGRHGHGLAHLAEDLGFAEDH